MTLSNTAHILRLVDIASDFTREASERGSSEELGMIITQLERIAAGLGALALIEVRKDEDLSSFWMDY